MVARVIAKLLKKAFLANFCVLAFISQSILEIVRDHRLYNARCRVRIAHLGRELSSVRYRGKVRDAHPTALMVCLGCCDFRRHLCFLWIETFFLDSNPGAGFQMQQKELADVIDEQAGNGRAK